jgi:hypothetical protein
LRLLAFRSRLRCLALTLALGLLAELAPPRWRADTAGSCEAVRMSDIRSPTVTIADGVDMPLLGLGTWQASDQEAYDAVRIALDLGYRLIDTATMYGNEGCGPSCRARQRCRA